MTAPSRMALEVDGVSKRFGGTLALDDVDLRVRAGTVHALLGANGSGKSTLVKILAGVHQATTGGDIAVEDRTVASTSITPAGSAALGLRFVHQQLGLFQQLSIADNFAATAGYGGHRFSSINRRTLERRTAAMLESLGIEASPRDRVDGLRPSSQTLVAIGRAMADAQTARVLVLDEPTESLPDDETARLLSSIRTLARGGMTFVIVSHRLAEIAEVADDATVLRDGRVVASAPIADLPQRTLVEHITGRQVAAATTRNAGKDRSGQPLLTVRDLSVGSVRGFSLDLREGEIVGIAGLIGSGRSAVLEGLFGARRTTAGEVALRGRTHTFEHPGDAIRAGIALVPESRSSQALFADHPVAQNISAATVRRFFTRGSLDRRAERRHAATRVEALGIKAGSVDAAMSTLSGGNQQKAIIARWLDTSPQLLLLDEPTQGVDVGARAEIHAIIRDAVSRGMSVILVSSDLDELCAMSDRVVVLRRGTVAHEISEDLTVSRIAQLMHESAPVPAGPG